MFKYFLTLQVWESGDYSSVEVLGTFDEIANVNEFLYSAGYPSRVKFISCRQIIETTIKGKAIRLDLRSVPFNPIDRIGELRNAFKQEETIKDLRCAMDQTTDDMIANEDLHVTVEPRFLSGELFLHFCLFGISLLKDGTWKYEDTGYGSDHEDAKEGD